MKHLQDFINDKVAKEGGTILAFPKEKITEQELNKIIKAIDNKHVKKNWDNIDFLDMRGVDLTDNAFSLLCNYLKRKKTIKGVDLSGCKLGDQKAKMIVEACNVAKVSELVLINNNITNKGARNIAEVINEHSSLKILDIRDNSTSENIEKNIKDKFIEKKIKLDAFMSKHITYTPTNAGKAHDFFCHKDLVKEFSSSEKKYDSIEKLFKEVLNNEDLQNIKSKVITIDSKDNRINDPKFRNNHLIYNVKVDKTGKKTYKFLKIPIVVSEYKIDCNRQYLEGEGWQVKFYKRLSKDQINQYKRLRIRKGLSAIKATSWELNNIRSNQFLESVKEKQKLKTPKAINLKDINIQIKNTGIQIEKIKHICNELEKITSMLYLTENWPEETGNDDADQKKAVKFVEIYKENQIKLADRQEQLYQLEQKLLKLNYTKQIFKEKKTQDLKKFKTREQRILRQEGITINLPKKSKNKTYKFNYDETFGAPGINEETNKKTYDFEVFDLSNLSKKELDKLGYSFVIHGESSVDRITNTCNGLIDTIGKSEKELRKSKGLWDTVPYKSCSLLDPEHYTYKLRALVKSDTTAAENAPFDNVACSWILEVDPLSIIGTFHQDAWTPEVSFHGLKEFNDYINKTTKATIAQDEQELQKIKYSPYDTPYYKQRLTKIKQSIGHSPLQSPQKFSAITSNKESTGRGYNEMVVLTGHLADNLGIRRPKVKGILFEKKYMDRLVKNPNLDNAQIDLLKKIKKISKVFNIPIILVDTHRPEPKLTLYNQIKDYFTNAKNIVQYERLLKGNTEVKDTSKNIGDYLNIISEEIANFSIEEFTVNNYINDVCEATFNQTCFQIEEHIKNLKAKSPKSKKVKQYENLLIDLKNKQISIEEIIAAGKYKLDPEIKNMLILLIRLKEKSNEIKLLDKATYKAKKKLFDSYFKKEISSEILRKYKPMLEEIVLYNTISFERLNKSLHSDVEGTLKTFNTKMNILCTKAKKMAKNNKNEKVNLLQHIKQKDIKTVLKDTINDLSVQNQAVIQFLMTKANKRLIETHNKNYTRYKPQANISKKFDANITNTLKKYDYNTLFHDAKKIYDLLTVYRNLVKSYMHGQATLVKYAKFSHEWKLSLLLKHQRDKSGLFAKIAKCSVDNYNTNELEQLKKDILNESKYNPLNSPKTRDAFIKNLLKAVNLLKEDHKKLINSLEEKYNGKKQLLPNIEAEQYNGLNDLYKSNEKGYHNEIMFHVSEKEKATTPIRGRRRLNVKLPRKRK